MCLIVRHSVDRAVDLAVSEHRTDACAAINHGVPCRTSGTAGMLPGLLRQQEEAADDERGNDR